MCCSIATRNCNHNLFELILIHQLLNCNKRLQYVANTTRNLGEKSKNKSIYSYAMYMGKKPALHADQVCMARGGSCTSWLSSSSRFAARCVACLWCPGMWVTQSYKQTRSAWHVVEVVRPCCVRAPDFRPGVWPACGAQGCESLRQSSGSVPVRD